MASELIRLIARQADGRGWLGVTAFALLIATPLLLAWMALPLLDASRLPPPATATPQLSLTRSGGHSASSISTIWRAEPSQKSCPSVFSCQAMRWRAISPRKSDGV